MATTLAAVFWAAGLLGCWGECAAAVACGMRSCGSASNFLSRLRRLVLPLTWTAACTQVSPRLNHLHVERVTGFEPLLLDVGCCRWTPCLNTMEPLRMLCGGRMGWVFLHFLELASAFWLNCNTCRVWYEVR